MAALSIHLPDPLLKQSSEIAKSEGISRTQFIRQAVKRAVKHYYQQKEMQAMAEGFAAMSDDPHYQAEIRELEAGFGATLTEDDDDWYTNDPS